MNKIAWVVFGSLMLAAFSHAASFDCANASTKIEKMICSDAELSQLDEDLTAAYKSALKDEKQIEAVRHDQKLWIKERNSCSDIACVKESYKTRIAVLTLGTKVAIIEGDGNPVCSEVSLNKVHHIEFNFLNAMSEYAVGVHANDGLAKVDIDNDGHSDNVVRLNLSYGRCESSFLAVTDDSRTYVPDTKLNKILKNLASCSSGFHELFILNGVIFVDVQDQDNNRTIYRVKNENADVICKFQGYTSFSEGPEQ